MNLILVLPPLNQYDAAASDLRDMFTSKPDFRPYALTSIGYAKTVSPVWLAASKRLNFKRPDADEVQLRAAILKSEGLLRPKPAPPSH